MKSICAMFVFSLATIAGVALAADVNCPEDQTPEKEGEYITTSFKDVPLEMVGAFLDSITGKKHIVEGRGSIRIDFMNSEKITTAEADQHFVRVARQLGCTVYEEGDTIRVVKPASSDR